MQAWCVLRREKDWHLHQRLSPHFLKHWDVMRICEVWDRLFNLSYIEFRQRVFVLTKDTIAQAGFDRVVPMYEVDTNSLFDKLVFPTDDDDWFRDDIISIIHDQPWVPVYRWNFIEYSTGTIEIHKEPFLLDVPPWKMTYNIQSNNYAIRSPRRMSYVEQHGSADQRYREDHHYLYESLSVHNKTLASLSLLRHVISDLGNELVRLYEIYQKDPVVKYGDSLPTYFSSLVDRMLSIYRNQLRLK